MSWGFIWLMFVLKIPILGLFYIVWWAVRQTDEPAPPQPVRVAPPRLNPHRPARRPPRRRPRGPHGGPAVVPSPPRVRPARAVATRVQRRS